MLLSILILILGLILLLWSADRFVEGAASTARYFSMPPLLIGMVVVGFGTSAPEMLVSAMAAVQSNPGIALGNAYGSNITNIALILGLTAVVRPIIVQSQILRNELPILLAVTGLAAWQLRDGQLTRFDAMMLLLVFALLLAWTIWQGLQNKSDALAGEMAIELESAGLSLPRSLVWLAIGLLLLIVSSRLLVWGAVNIAQAFGISDLIIGLTIIAVGTSLPELASSLIAAKKGEHDIALGNILGSNLFNTLAVVGIAAVIRPLAPEPEVLNRDLLVVAILTLSLFAIGYGYRRAGRINRIEGALLLLGFFAYTLYLLTQTG
ncbi:MAG: calcium/sodium antiporter [Puniceicoccaceae bacterium]